VVFLATGRIPNTQGLGLDKAGVSLNDKGAVKVDPSCYQNIDKK